MHAVLIERAGRLIYEEYFDGFDERWGTPLGPVKMTAETLHDLRSVTKSVVSALAGIALGASTLKSLDQPVIEWFPEYPELNTAERRRVTLAQVLNMTSGLQWNEEVPYNDPRNDEIRMTRDSQPLRYALSRPFANDPGSEFNYNGGLTQVWPRCSSARRKRHWRSTRERGCSNRSASQKSSGGGARGMPAAASDCDCARATSPSSAHCTCTWSMERYAVIPADWIQISTRRHFRFRPRTGPDASGQFAMPTFGGTIAIPLKGAWRGAHGCRQRTAAHIRSTRSRHGRDDFRGRYTDFTNGAALGARILRQHVILLSRAACASVSQAREVEVDAEWRAACIKCLPNERRCVSCTVNRRRALLLKRDHTAEPRPLVIAHRGRAATARNTRWKLRAAIAMGADFIEPDLVSTRDGLLVARHENEIGGTTDVAAKYPPAERQR